MTIQLEKEIRTELEGSGLAKLPPDVLMELCNRVRADVVTALKASIAKRTSGRAVARVFAEFVMVKTAGDSKGAQSPFGQLRSVHLEDETVTLIGTHSGGTDSHSKQEDGK
jgi:hypothetical protein